MFKNLYLSKLWATCKIFGSVVFMFEWLEKNYSCFFEIMWPQNPALLWWSIKPLNTNSSLLFPPQSYQSFLKTTQVRAVHVRTRTSSNWLKKISRFPVFYSDKLLNPKLNPKLYILFFLLQINVIHFLFSLCINPFMYCCGFFFFVWLLNDSFCGSTAHYCFIVPIRTIKHS